VLYWIGALAHALSFPWGFVFLCSVIGAAIWFGAALARWSLLWASFCLITWQRQLGLVPSQLQYGLEVVVDAAPKAIHRVLRYLGGLLLLWLVAYLLRAFITIPPFYGLLTFLSRSAEVWFHSV
jgi:hypothetical protein